MTYTNARCTVESDGYHLHEYQSGAAVVTEHCHTWIDEHDDPHHADAEWRHTGKPRPHRAEPVEGSIRMVEAAANSAG